MDDRHRKVIEEYRNLITNNLILTEEFYRALITYGVFSEGLLKELRVCAYLSTCQAKSSVTLEDNNFLFPYCRGRREPSYTVN